MLRIPGRGRLRHAAQCRIEDVFVSSCKVISQYDRHPPAGACPSYDMSSTNSIVNALFCVCIVNIALVDVGTPSKPWQ